MIIHNENEDENEEIYHIDTTLVELGLDRDTNMVNVKTVSVW